MSKFGQIARLLVPFTVDELGDSLGIGRATAYRWRSGDGLPPPARLAAIAEATDIPLEVLRRAYGRDIAARKARRAAP